MDVEQLQSFVIKFRQLWAAGETAHLDLDTHAGKAWVGLRVQLGGPVHHQHYPSRPQHRSPAYHRRQERRQAARAAAGKPSQVVIEAEEVTDTTTEPTTEEATSAEEANDAVVETVEAHGHNANDFIGVSDAEQASDQFSCELCDFESKWRNGLEIHMTRKHGTLEQIDGVICDGKQDLVYDRSDYYWKTGRIGISYQTYIDIIDVVQNSELSEREKEEEKLRVTEARKKTFGNNFKHFPPWK